MAVPTGSASMGDIRSEWDRTGSISMSEMYRGGTYVKTKAADNTADNLAADVPTSGEISVDDFRGEARGFRYTFTTGATDQNASTIFGDDYDLDYPKEIVINSGVELGATSTTEEALEVPSGAAGSITITNNGTLTGAGGAAGSAGGDAFEAASTCTFINNGTVRAGGGGGGAGGNGSYTNTTSYSWNWFITGVICESHGPSIFLIGDSCIGGCWQFGGCQSNRGEYYRGTTVRGTSGNRTFYDIERRQSATQSGPSGGVGAGYQQTASSGGSASNNSGTGGDGGGFGAAGSDGSNGTATNGVSGGAAGNYLRGSSFVTFTNNGTAQGNTV